MLCLRQYSAVVFLLRDRESNWAIFIFILCNPRVMITMCTLAVAGNAVVPQLSHEFVHVKAFIAFARAKGVKRFVLISASQFEPGQASIGRIHQYIVDSGADYAIIRFQSDTALFSSGRFLHDERITSFALPLAGSGRRRRGINIFQFIARLHSRIRVHLHLSVLSFCRFLRRRRLALRLRGTSSLAFHGLLFLLFLLPLFFLRPSSWPGSFHSGNGFRIPRCFEKNGFANCTHTNY